MKIEINSTGDARGLFPRYPWLGAQYHEKYPTVLIRVVMFTRHNSGIVLLGGDLVPRFDSNMDENYYQPYSGSVTLSNG